MLISSFPKRRRILLVGLAVLYSLPLFLLRFNFSPSMGGTLLLRLLREPRLGDRVLVCLPEELARVADARGYAARRLSFCSSGVVLYKRLAAVPGDHVQLTDAAPRIDGAPRGSAGPTHDRHRRPLVAFRLDRRLADGECLVLGDHVRSWDSRYFGPVPCDALEPVGLLR